MHLANVSFTEKLLRGHVVWCCIVISCRFLIFALSEIDL